MLAEQHERMSIPDDDEYSINKKRALHVMVGDGACGIGGRVTYFVRCCRFRSSLMIAGVKWL
jgi:hypothetical protein